MANKDKQAETQKTNVTTVDSAKMQPGQTNTQTPVPQPPAPVPAPLTPEQQAKADADAEYVKERNKNRYDESVPTVRGRAIHVLGPFGPTDGQRYRISYLDNSETEIVRESEIKGLKKENDGWSIVQ